MIKVVVSAIIKNEEEKVLAVKLAKEIVGGVWVPPGGKLEEDETARDCLKREVREELGIEIEIVDLVGVSEEEYKDGYWVFLLYSAKIIKGIPKSQEKKKVLEIKYIKQEERRCHSLCA